MPQSKSAKKALRQSEKRRRLNLRYKRKMKELIKELRTLIKEGKKAAAEKLLPQVYKAIDKAAKKNIIKKGNAARKKSRLTMALNKIGKKGEREVRPASGKRTAKKGLLAKKKAVKKLTANGKKK